MKNTKFFVVFTVVLLTIIISCNKDDESSPEIRVKLPLQNQSFVFGDTIFISAEIKDKNQIVSVSVSLVNSSKQEVSPQQYQTYSEKQVNINNEIIIDDPLLESGQYFIHIVARNQNNSKSFFQPIQITGVQRELKGLFIITKPSPQNVSVLLVDSTETVSPFMSVSGDYLNSDINNKYQKLVICGSKTGDLSAVNIDTKTVDWTIDNLSYLDNQFFYALFVNQNRIFVANRNSEIHCYDFFGGLAYSFTLTGQRYAEKLLVASNRVFAQTADVLGGTKRLMQFYTGSSLVITDHTISMDIKSWYWNNGKLLVFANTGNTGRIYSYNYENNTFTLLNNTSSAIIQSDEVSVQDYFVVCNDGVYLYKANSSNALNQIISGNEIVNLIFDSENQRIFIHQSYKVEAYSYPDIQKVFEYNSSNEIVNLHLWYNK